jgi:hypothetical protein
VTEHGSTSGPHAWRAALVEAPQTERSHAEVPRLVLDVTLDDGSRGLVTVSLREGALRAVDEQGERGSALSGAALSFLGALAGKDAAASLGPLAGVDRAAPRPSHAPPARSLDAARELALSLVRSGLAGARRGAIDEPLRRARASGELRIARWAARFEAAVAAEDLPLLAQLARGVLGAPPAPVSSRVDLRLVEVAREHVDATGARSLARRHLLDPASGSAFVEEHDAGAPPGSIGPMPRTLEVGLAEVIEDPGQPSLRVLQYTTSPIVPSELYARLFELACRDVSAALDHVDRLVRASPAFAEPLVLFAPDRWDSVRALDAAGRELPLSAHEDPAASLRLGEVLAEREPALVVVRAAPLHGVHAFVPLSCVLAEPTGGWRFVRLRG